MADGTVTTPPASPALAMKEQLDRMAQQLLNVQKQLDLVIEQHQEDQASRKDRRKQEEVVLALIAATKQGLQTTTDDLAKLQSTVHGCKKDLADLAGLVNDHQASLTRRLDDLPVQLRPVPLPRWRRWFPWGAGALGGVLLAGCCWWALPPSRTEAFAGALDAVLAESYAGLPKAVQDRLTAVYGTYRFQPPGARPKGGK